MSDQDPRRATVRDLTPQEVENIGLAWDEKMGPCRDVVKRFLAGSDALDCGCPKCGTTIRLGAPA